jgi:predicted Rossmann fold nucleotide-binding protein DprA/Smf involved in DNA uptake
VTSADDVLFGLGIKPTKNQQQRVFKGGRVEQTILDLIGQGINSSEEIALSSQLDGPTIFSALTMLEIAGQVRPVGSGRYIKI